MGSIRAGEQFGIPFYRQFCPFGALSHDVLCWIYAQLAGENMVQLMNEMTASDSMYGKVMATLAAVAVLAAAAIAIIATAAK